MYHILLPLTIKAPTDIPKGRFLRADGTIAGLGEPCLGVSRFNAKEGEHLTVDVLGVAVVESAGSFPKGTYVQSAPDGRCLAWWFGSPCGIAMSEGQTGREVSILLLPGFLSGPDIVGFTIQAGPGGVEGGRLVKADGTMTTGPSDAAIGFAAFSAPQGMSVRVITTGVTRAVVSGTAISVGDVLVPANEGKVQKLSGANQRPVAVALESGTDGASILVSIQMNLTPTATV